MPMHTRAFINLVPIVCFSFDQHQEHRLWAALEVARVSVLCADQKKIGLWGRDWAFISHRTQLNPR